MFNLKRNISTESTKFFMECILERIIKNISSLIVKFQIHICNID